MALETGRGRAETAARLAELVFEEPDTVIGLDFCFSAPAWFLDAQGMRSAGELWRWAARQAEQHPRFVRELPEPFWGPGVRRRPVAAGAAFRRTEQELDIPGAHPSSFFKVSGPGSVGAQSLLGMPELLVLCDCGVTVWPFDVPRLPVAVEVFPRALARLLAPDAVGVTGAAFRTEVIALHAGAFGDLARVAENNQDAFDAAVAALALDGARDLVGQLARTRAEQDLREGAILIPELG